MYYFLSRAPIDAVYDIVSVCCLACLGVLAALCTPLIHPAEALSLQFAVELILDFYLLRLEGRAQFAVVGSLSYRSLF